MKKEILIQITSLRKRKDDGTEFDHLYGLSNAGRLYEWTNEGWTFRSHGLED